MHSIKSYLLLLFCLAGSFCHAQNISLVKDLNPGNANSLITSYRGFGNDLYFSETKTGHANLWKTDGTASGTVLIHAGFISDITFMNVFANKLFFVANDSVHGNELWSTDGTAAGTQLVKDIYPGTGDGIRYYSSSTLDTGFVMNNRLFFDAFDGSHTTQIWSTDGTTQGTSMYLDICATCGTFGGVSPMNYINGKIFMAGQTASDYGAMVTDGTMAGTHLLLSGLARYQFLKLDNKAAFIWTDTTQIPNTPPNTLANWLCITDGTVAGTTKLLLIDSTYTGNYSLLDHVYLNGRLLLYFNNKLIITDGTSAGSTIIKTGLTSGGSGGIGYNRIWLTELNGKAYFSAKDASTGAELWESDGTPAGTHMMIDITPYSYPWSTTASFNSFPVYLTKAGNEIYFKAADSTTIGIWKTDGTPANTVKISGNGYSSSGFLGLIPIFQNMPGEFTYFNHNVYCNIAIDTPYGKELYKVSIPNSVNDVQQPGTTANIYPNPNDGLFYIDGVEGIYDAEVVNIFGQPVWTKKHCSGREQPDLGLIPNGVYTLSVSSGVNTITRKIVVSH